MKNRKGGEKMSKAIIECSCAASFTILSTHTKFLKPITCPNCGREYPTSLESDLEKYFESTQNIKKLVGLNKGTTGQFTVILQND